MTIGEFIKETLINLGWVMFIFVVLFLLGYSSYRDGYQEGYNDGMTDTKEIYGINDSTLTLQEMDSVLNEWFKNNDTLKLDFE